MTKWTTAAKTIALLLVIFWGIEIVDTFIFSDWFQGNGIYPRKIKGLDGILWHPFLHGGFSHIASNTLPFAVLGGFVALKGYKYWAEVTIFSVLIGGGLTWLLASGGNHIGASGIVFAYFGAILGSAAFERKPAALAVAIVVIFLYSSLIIGLVPQPEISWEGHLFGFLTGIAIAYIHREPKQKREPIVYEPDPASYL